MSVSRLDSFRPDLNISLLLFLLNEGDGGKGGKKREKQACFLKSKDGKGTSS